MRSRGFGIILWPQLNIFCKSDIITKDFANGTRRLPAQKLPLPVYALLPPPLRLNTPCRK